MTTTTNPGALLQERLQKIERARAATAAQQARAATTPAPAPTQQPARLAPTPACTETPSAAVAAGKQPRGSLTAQQRLVWDIVRAAQLAGARDLTRAEIRERMERQSGQRVSDGTVTGRVHELLREGDTAGWLVEQEIKRACTASRSGQEAFAVYVPPHLLHASPKVRGRR